MQWRVSLARTIVVFAVLIASSVGRASAADDFGKLFQEWKTLLSDLEKLQLDYKTVKPEERKGIRTKFEELVAKGDGLKPRLVAAAETAYKADPAKNTDAADILSSFAVQARNADNYEEALRAATALIEGKYDNARVYAIAGVAAYQTNDYDAAEKYLKQADEKSALDARDKPLLEALPKSREAWAAEKKLRDAEAKADDLPRVELDTSKGKIVVELFENEAPNTVANFINLVENKFYDGLSFHRVLEGFMAQGGDPKGDGSGGPGYTIKCECSKPEHRNHFRGSLSMAHAGPDTGGSQFFLTFVRTDFLDGKHTVFGRVIEGLDVLSRIQRRDPDSPNKPQPDKILSAKVLRKRDHKYEPEKLEDKK